MIAMIISIIVIISSSSSISSSIVNYHYSEAVPDKLRRFYLTAVGYRIRQQHVDTCSETRTLQYEQLHASYR